MGTVHQLRIGALMALLNGFENVLGKQTLKNRHKQIHKPSVIMAKCKNKAAPLIINVICMNLDRQNNWVNMFPISLL